MPTDGLVPSIRPFDEGWQTYNERLVGVIRPMSMDQLLLRPAPTPVSPAP